MTPKNTDWGIAADLFRLAPGSRSTLTLSAAAVAVATAVLLLMASMVGAVDARADRQNWLSPMPAERPAAVQRTTTAYLEHRPVTVVHLAPTPNPAGTRPSPLPAPPGMHRFPGPGEVALSPALSRQLYGRGESLGLGTTPTTSTLDEEALGGPDELLAVVGHNPDDPVMKGPAFRGIPGEARYTDAVGISSFTGRPGSPFVETYGPASVAAAAMLAMPVLGLLSAVAGLGARARADRFARWRLAGTPARVVNRVVAVESATVCTVGVIAGVLLHLVTMPLAARLPMAGTRFATSDLLVSTPVAATLAALVAALVTSRMWTLTRGAVRRPLDTAAALPTSLPVWWRIGLSIAAVGLFVMAQQQDDKSPELILMALLTVFGSISLLGPIGVFLCGQVLLSRSSAAALIAGRRLVGAPRTAWQTISGVVLAGFTAGLFALVGTGGSSYSGGEPGAIELPVPAANVQNTASALGRALTERGVRTPVTVEKRSPAIGTASPTTTTWATLQVAEDSPAVRAAMHSVFQGAQIVSVKDRAGQSLIFLSDVHRASIFILMVSFGLAVASVTVTAITGITERRATFRRLRAAGTPVGTLLAARRQEALVPLVACTAAASVAGLLIASPVTLLSGTTPSPWGLSTMAIALICGLLAVSSALAATSGRLRRENRP